MNRLQGKAVEQSVVYYTYFQLVENILAESLVYSIGIGVSVKIVMLFENKSCSNLNMLILVEVKKENCFVKNTYKNNNNRHYPFKLPFGLTLNKNKWSTNIAQTFTLKRTNYNCYSCSENELWMMLYIYLNNSRNSFIVP